VLGLSEIQNFKSNDEGLKIFGLKSDEIDTVREFFDLEIRGNDAVSVLKTYKKLLKEI
jgi:hypothetical protein